MDYKEAGVDRDGADAFIEAFASRMKREARPEILSEVGDFGGFFEAPRNYRDPIFVATTDGIGTKLALAEAKGGEAHRGMGQDVVAMCVNDLAACGAEPLIFLDYIATGRLDPSSMNLLLEGVLRACKDSGCSLIGGETAEMPGFYPIGRYDVAGFSLGVLERSERFSKAQVQSGDLLMGLSSSGFHSNGYSLIRKILENEKWSLDLERFGVVLGDFLLRPTHLYPKYLLEVRRKLRTQLKGACHITGGGLIENLPRIADCRTVKFRVNKNAIQTPPWMTEFCGAGKIETQEAFATWNMGVGFVFVIAPEALASIPKPTGFEVFQLGEMVAKSEKSEADVELVSK